MKLDSQTIAGLVVVVLLLFAAGYYYYQGKQPASRCPPGYTLGGDPAFPDMCYTSNATTLSPTKMWYGNAPVGQPQAAVASQCTAAGGVCGGWFNYPCYSNCGNYSVDVTDGTTPFRYSEADGRNAETYFMMNPDGVSTQPVPPGVSAWRHPAPAPATSA